MTLYEIVHDFLITNLIDTPQCLAFADLWTFIILSLFIIVGIKFVVWLFRSIGGLLKW